MTPWQELNAKNLHRVPKNILGIFQLAKEVDKIAYVGRADADLHDSLEGFLSTDYRYFQWVRVPWTKEGFEMQCRLYHHGGGRSLENSTHPFPPQGEAWNCPLSCKPAAICEEQYS